MSAVLEANPKSSSRLPHLAEHDDILAPEAPRDLGATGLDKGQLADLALKTAHLLPQCTTKWVAEQMRLPVPMVDELLEGLATDHLLDKLGHEGPFNHRYAISARGHERALRILSVSGYVGPAPVTLETYSEMMYFQHSQFPEVTLADVRAALKDLILPAEDLLTAALAFMSQRSLFVFGPSGNGKTTLARLLHNVVERDLWIPHAIAVGTDVIRIFDPQVHDRVEVPFSQPWRIDQRWIRVRRPFVVAGGEMTIETLELSFSQVQGFYEAPLHIKSNGGTFVIDDLGRQRVEPAALLNRWIVPLEHGYDYFTLKTGQKIRVPFQQMLIVATNLDPDRVMDPAFMRRMGYRVHLSTPSAQRYQEIFHQFADRWRAQVPDGVLDRLVLRYKDEGRELRGCEPRDLIGRVQDICRLRRQPMEISDELLALAWTSYFGTKWHYN